MILTKQKNSRFLLTLKFITFTPEFRIAYRYNRGDKTAHKYTGQVALDNIVGNRGTRISRISHLCSSTRVFVTISSGSRMTEMLTYTIDDEWKTLVFLIIDLVANGVGFVFTTYIKPKVILSPSPPPTHKRVFYSFIC